MAESRPAKWLWNRADVLLWLSYRPELPYVATMSKGQPGTETLQAAIMKLWLEGAPIAWKVPEAGSQQEEGESPPIVSEPANSIDPACSAQQVEG